MTRSLHQFARAREGVAIVEFGLMLPVLMTLFYGCIELTRYILIVQKTEKLAHTVADVTAQSKTVSIANLDQLMEAAGDIMEPFDTGENSRVLVNSVYRPPGNGSVATINWRYQSGGDMAVTSHLGAVGSQPTMPGGFTFNPRENVIAVEVFYRFDPLLTADFFGTTTIYRSAFYKPRLGLLTTAPS